MSTILELIAKGLPPGLRPFAKAVLPALGTLIAVGAQAGASGTFDKAELSTAIAGLSTALVAYLATNHDDLTVETDDLPDVDNLEAFAISIAGVLDPEAELALDADEDVPADTGTVQNGNADVIITNGPRT